MYHFSSHPRTVLTLHSRANFFVYLAMSENNASSTKKKRITSMGFGEVSKVEEVRSELVDR
jgi:hypothetical protein